MPNQVTPNSIRTLPANRKTDAKVRLAMDSFADYRSDPPKHYTANTPEGWAAMRECVEWLRGRGLIIMIDCYGPEWGVGVAGNCPPTALTDMKSTSLPHAVGLLVVMVSESLV